MADQRLIPPGIRDASTVALNELIDRLGTLDITPLLVYLIDYVEEPALPHLAEQFSVTGYDGWALAQGTTNRRELIKRAIELHRRKGTPWAVKTALASVGYPDATIIEHRQHHQAWLAAGGELLDGVGYLTGSSDLSAPGGQFRFTTRHWAEFSIRPNIAGGSWSRRRQQEITDIVREYAPVRSRLVAITLAAGFAWDVAIRLVGSSARITTRFAHCQRTPVPSFETLDGCTEIGGETLVNVLDGLSTLNGDSLISGVTLIGSPLDGGQLSLKVKMGTRLSFAAAGGDRIETTETLGDGYLLDGGAQISGPLLDGYSVLDGITDLSYPTLAHPDSYLTGDSNLGSAPGLPGVWFSGALHIRRGSTQYTEVM